MPLETPPFTFLQVSDVHLDSKLASSKLALPHSKRQERNQEILEALLRAFREARQRQVDAILIPGDLWDSESVGSRTINTLIEAMGELADIPVVIAPGNHDYCSTDSLYSATALAARGMRPWPANVHIFSSPQFTTFTHPARQDVSFTGRAFTQNVPVTQRLLSGGVERNDDCPLNILLFHGSLDGYKGGDVGRPGKATAPFSAAELADLGFTYAAVGHYHDHTEIRSNLGTLLGAYSGCLAGRWFDESGERTAVFGKIEFDQDGPCECKLERVEFDSRRLVSVSCDITGSTAGEAVAEVQSLLSAAGAREGADLVMVRLDGRHPTGGEPLYVIDALKGQYWHLVVDDQSRPDYLSERYDKRTTEGKFIQAMRDLQKKAESGGGVLEGTEYGSALTGEVIEDALYYGLDALKQKKVTVRHVD